MYEIRLTHDAQKSYRAAEGTLVKRLHRCFDQLRRNPHEHSNIKRLKGPLAGYWRYRVGDWRVVYRIDDDNRAVVVILVVHRSKAYR